MIDIETKIKSLKITWLKRALLQPNSAWVSILDSLLQNISFSYLVHCSAISEHILKRLPPLYQEILKDWQLLLEANNPPQSLNEILQERLCFNKNITSENIVLWQNAIDALSLFENVSIKLSGFSERIIGDWNNNDIKPFIDYSIEKFSVERCMFGTNFPVDKAFSPKTYIDYWDSYHTITSHLSSDEKDSLFFKNAEKYYKI